jgi:putative membrane protein
MKFPLALLPLVGVNLLSLFGFATFAANPDYLKMFPWAEPIMEISYPLFSRLQILLAFGAVIFTIRKNCSRVWIKSFFAIILTSLASELIGTTYGIPFGAYGYSSLLGYKVLDRVPWLIPLSWFYMSLASYDLIRSRITVETFSLKRIFGSAILLLVWDLVLDPAMSRLAPFWYWQNPEGLLGTPNSNLIGWWVTGLALMSWLEFFKAHQWLKKMPHKFLTYFYFANLMLPLGMCLLSQLWLPVVLVGVVLLPILFIPSAHSISGGSQLNEKAS